ncbi:MAG TPA: ACP S-malonyltransferase [Micromonosporaceae bacterium]
MPEDRSAEAGPVGGRPADARPADRSPIGSRPADRRPADRGPDRRPADRRPGDPLLTGALLSAAAPGPAFLFPGQGSQYPGMARDLTVCGPNARALVAEAERVTGHNLTALMTNADAATIANPELAQLLVFVSSSVLFTELRDRGVRPTVVAGHSLGEYTALVACGSLEWRTALSLVAFRGRAMADAAAHRPGTMGAVVGLPVAKVEHLCRTVAGNGDGVAVVANVNSGRQVVVSGTTDEVETVLERARSTGALRARRIPVGGAYHSPLMTPARESLAGMLREATLRPPETPFVSSVTGDLVTDIEAYRKPLLEQVTRPVRWHSVVQRFATAGIAQYVEAGPGRVLSGLVRETARGTHQQTALEALRGRQTTAAVAGQLESA